MYFNQNILHSVFVILLKSSIQYSSYIHEQSTKYLYSFKSIVYYAKNFNARFVYHDS